MEFKFCTNCGGKISVESRFCGFCGADVSAQQVVPVQEPQVEVPVGQEDFEATKVWRPAQPEDLDEERTVYMPSGSAFQHEDKTERQPVYQEPVYQTPVQQPVYQEPVYQTPVQQPAYQEPIYQAPPQPVVYRNEQEPEPVYEPYAAMNVPAKKDKKALRYGPRGVGRTILAVLLCFVIFILSGAALMVGTARLVTSQNTVASAVDSILWDLAEMPAADLIDEARKSDGSVMEYIIREVEDEYNVTVDLDKKDLEEFLEESAILNVLGQKMGAYVDDLFNDTGKSGVDADEIREILEEDRDLIEDMFGQKLSDLDIEAIVMEIEDSEVLEVLDAKTLEKTAPEVVGVVRFGLSLWALILLIVLVVLFVVLLAVTNRWNLISTSRDLGITLTVLGAIFSLATMIPVILLTALGEDGIVGTLLAPMLNIGRLPSLYVLLGGVVLILTACVSGLIRKAVVNRNS